MGSPHLEKIKQLIAKSLILQDHEREEWLMMAETMNDKQLSDLESILTQDKPTVVNSAAQNNPTVPTRPLPHLQNAPKPASVQQMPPGSHGVSKSVPAVQPLLVLNARKTVTPPAAPLPQKPIPVKPFPVAPPTQVQERFPTDHTTKGLLDSLRTLTLKKPELAGMETSVSVSSIRSLSDASRVNLKVLRSLGRDALRTGLQQLMPQYSYHDVLFAFEQSPVYQLFLLTGNTLLQNSNPVTSLPESDSEAVLSQEEFTFLTELPWLLRKRS